MLVSAACASQAANTYSLCTMPLGYVRVASVVESYVVRQRPKQGNPTSEKHRDTCDDQPLDQAGLQKALDGHTAIDIEMLQTTGTEPSHDLVRGAGHHFTHRSGRCSSAAGLVLRTTTGFDP